MGIEEKFKKFCNKLPFSKDEKETIDGRLDTISKRLNKDFWEMDTSSGGKFVGSFGRKTANSWESDIDMLFEMPLKVYNQYNDYVGNGQSALLQAVKNSITKTYSNTDVRGDGQVVVVKFDSMHFEVLPAWKNSGGTYTYPDTNNGGSWKTTNPDAEIQAIQNIHALTNNNLINLCMMLRAWNRFNSVPLGGLLIDTFASVFLSQWYHKNQSYLYYDFMTRDFFNYILSNYRYQTSWYAIGSLTTLYAKGEFIPKVEKAYQNALDAIEFESKNEGDKANAKWAEIYGARFPV